MPSKTVPKTPERGALCQLLGLYVTPMSPLCHRLACENCRRRGDFPEGRGCGDIDDIVFPLFAFFAPSLFFSPFLFSNLRG